MALGHLDLDVALAHLVVDLVETDLTDVVLVPQVIRRRRFVHLCRPEFYILVRTFYA